MTLAALPDDDLGEIIDEEPMEKSEFEQALYHHLSRSERHRFWRALDAARLIVFRE